MLQGYALLSASPCSPLVFRCFLCSRDLFLPFQVEAIIQPRFLEELLSPEPQLDLVALSMELEQEEGLTSGQVKEGGTSSE